MADSKSDKNLRQRKDSVPGRVLEGGRRVLQNAKRQSSSETGNLKTVFPGSQDVKLARSSEALQGMFPSKPLNKRRASQRGDKVQRRVHLASPGAARHPRY